MKWLAGSLLLAMLALFPACADDPTFCDDCCDDCEIPVAKFLPLTSRSAVLNNIEVAWNKRNAARIDELLDTDFTFYFASTDVGGEIPASWNRIEEIATADALFTSNIAPIPTVPVCLQVKVDLMYNKNGLIWTETTSASHPDETWYATTVNYTFAFQMEGDIVYVQNNAKAQFVVRPVGDEWRLVEWHDLGASIVMSNAVESSEQKNWTGSSSR